MKDFDTHDEQRANEIIREAFPADAGLSAEKTRRMYAELKPVATSTGRRRRAIWTWAAASMALVLVASGAFAAVSAFSAEKARVADLEASSRALAERDRAPLPPKKGIVGTSVPAMALKAISETTDILHYSSVADSEFGPDAGHSTEEMWYDPASGAGRLVRKDYEGESVVMTTTIISDGANATITKQRSGEASVTEQADPKGRWRRTFDRLSAYRNMLESGTATVTAQGTRDGVRTHKMRAEIEGFGGSEFDIVMEAEVRATDYLPISLTSTMRGTDGEVVRLLKQRTFSSFELMKASELPADWFGPQPGRVRTPSDGATGVYEF